MKNVMILTGADFLIDGGATTSYFYGPLRPETYLNRYAALWVSRAFSD